MTHDHEKSDLAIVAAKPTNKAGQPSTELVEPRAGAEGNASSQSTHRALDRDRVSQALERVSMMARNTNVPSRAGYRNRKTYHLQIITFGLHRAAGPYRRAWHLSRWV